MNLQLTTLGAEDFTLTEEVPDAMAIVAYGANVQQWPFSPRHK